MKRVNVMTINTDASHDPKTGAGGYAFYIKCDLFKIKKAGKFKDQTPSPLDAELKCIGNALATLLAQKELPEAKYLIINTDCLSAIRVIKNPIIKRGKEVHKYYKDLISKLNSKRNELRHVHAHTNKTDKRSLCNDWCDREARRYMKEQRNEFINLKIKLEKNEH